MSYLVERNNEVDVRAEGDMQDNFLFESQLASYIRRCWTEAKTAKEEMLERLLKCERQRRGAYDPDRAAEIAQTGGSDIFMMLTDVKCRAAESWIKDVMLNQQERVFELKPSKDPKMPPEMQMAIIDMVKREAEAFLSEGGELHPEAFRARMEEVHEEIRSRLTEEAADAARRMGDKIQDQLDHGKFSEAISKFISDFVTYPTAVMKGPAVKRRKNLAWGNDYSPVVVTEYIREVERVSPFDIFPAPSSTGVNDAFLFQKHRLSKSSLESMLGVKGTNDDALYTVMERYASAGYTNWNAGDSEHRALEGKPFRMSNQDQTVETLEFWGSVNGFWLQEWGIKDKDILEDKIYEVNVWMTGDIVWRAILNPDPLGERPYDIASWEEVPDSFWGVALPEVMRDTQVMCNAAARALANNMGVASGPQVEVTVDRLPDGEEISNVYPWKIWQVTTDRTGGGQPAVRFFQPNMNADVLLQVFQNFAKQADEVTGIPNYVYGSSAVSGAGRTASGLSMLMDNASKGIKQAISNIDRIVSGIVRRLYLHNMMYDDDPYIKGDFKVVAKGAIGLIHKEALQMRRNEFLVATANPIDSNIVGPEGRAYLLRELARGLQMDTEKIVPNQDTMRQQTVQAQAQMLAEQMLQQLASQQQAPAPQGTLPDGSPAGGQVANTVQPMPMADGGQATKAEQVLENLRYYGMA
jgi:hypothetical protein